MTEKKYCVYVHTNKVNGKKYIGITCRNPEVRWQNGQGYKRQPKFYAAIQKYGWDGFAHEILFDGLTLQEANDKEREMIELYDSMNNGYNLTEGGEGASGLHHTKESRVKMSQSRKGREMDEAWRKKLGDSHRGVPSKLRGSTLSDEHKHKIGEGLKEYYKLHPEETKDRKRHKFEGKQVICDGKLFDDIKSCAEFYSVDIYTMCRWLSGNSFVPEKFVQLGLSYVGYDPNYTSYKLNIEKVYYDGIIYDSLRQCVEKTGHCMKTLRDWIDGKTKSPIDIYLVPVYKYKAQPIKL